MLGKQLNIKYCLALDTKVFHFHCSGSIQNNILKHDVIDTIIFNNKCMRTISIIRACLYIFVIKKICPNIHILFVNIPKFTHKLKISFLLNIIHNFPV